jgi:hypothetical protein
MISKLIPLLIGLFVVILLIGFVAKMVKWGISLAVIVGIVALILHFMNKKA